MKNSLCWLKNKWTWFISFWVVRRSISGQGPFGLNIRTQRAPRLLEVHAVHKVWFLIHQIDLQLGTSSRAIHGGAYFSAVSGRKFNLTTVLRPCRPLACCWMFFSALCHFCIGFHWIAKSHGAGTVFSGGFVSKTLRWICQGPFFLFAPPTPPSPIVSLWRSE